MMKRSPVGVVARSAARGARVFGLFAGLVAAAGVAASARGANRIWEGGGIGDFSEPTNWLGDEVPGLGDTIIFNTAPEMTINFDDDVVAGRLLHSEGDLTLNLNGHALDLRFISSTSESWTSGVGSENSGDVNINGGPVISNYGSLSNLLGRRSLLILDDPAASFETRETFRVGSFGYGGMTLTNGARLVSREDLVLGEVAFGDGVVALSGAGTSGMVADQVQVGALGDGILRVNDGATMSCLEFFIAAFEASTGEMTMDGPGATFEATNAAAVGFDGGGFMVVENGAAFSTFQLRIGFSDISYGILRVQGDGALLTVDADTIIGSSGRGELIVRNGGRCDLGELSITSPTLGASASVSGKGSRLDVRDELRVGSIGDGLLEVLDGGLVTADNVEVNPGGLLTIDQGTMVFTSMVIAGQGIGGGSSARGLGGATGLMGNGSLTGDVICRGPFAPGPDFTTVDIDGSLTLDDPAELTLDFRMTSLGGEASDVVDVTGDVELGGTLRMELASGSLLPSQLQRVTIIRSGGAISGRFEDAEIPEVEGSSGRRMIIVENGGDVDLVATVMGDATGDGSVNSLDLAQVLAFWRTTDYNTDFNGDGVVDSEDLAVVLGFWGT